MLYTMNGSMKYILKKENTQMSNLKQKLKTGGIIAAAVVIILALDYGLNWIVTCVIIKLITMCFGLTFKWSIATGIWLIIYILKSVFNIEDLEDQLNKTYGDRDGLLSRVVGMLEKHPCIDMANNTSKSQLLTDKDVDKWDEYNQLDEQDRLIKLPCRIGDTVYVKMAPYCKTNYAEAEVKDFVHFISCGFCIVVTSKYFDKQNIPFSEFDKTVFLKKPEAETNLKESRDEEDE